MMRDDDDVGSTRLQKEGRRRDWSRVRSLPSACRRRRHHTLVIATNIIKEAD